MNTNSTNSLQLGTNLAGIADWSTQYPFTNYFKNSRDWITHGDQAWSTEEYDKLDLDENGYPKSLDGGKFTSVGTFIPNDNQGRRFVVLYDGQGTIDYRIGAKKDEAASQPGRDVFSAEPDGYLHLRITETDPNGTGDYLRNIRVVPEEYEDIYQTQIFNPDFLKSLEGYKTLRFMDWMDTNSSDQGEWSERPEINDVDYYGEGVPVEVMVELANQTGIDPWFNMPHLATDEYIGNFAQYVKENLDPNLKVHVELSNEVWNGQFAQANYAQEQQGGGDFGQGLQWYGQRTAEITQIWDEVFGADKERVMGVMGAQAENPWTAEQALKAIKDAGLSYEEAGIDAVAIAPYFGFKLGNEQVQAIENWVAQGQDYALDQLFKEVFEGGALPGNHEDGSIQRSADWIQKYVNFANNEELEVIAYEGGQHIAPIYNGMENNQIIADLFVAANRDPRMGEAYKQYFDMWNDLTGGNLFANFIDVGGYSKWGSWGVREDLYEESSPKFDVIKEILEAGSGATSDNPVEEPIDDGTVDSGSGVDDAEDTPDTDSPEADDHSNHNDEVESDLTSSETNDSTIELDGSFVISGTEQDDQIFGGEGVNTLDGGAGNDMIYDGSQMDIIFGGAGNDQIYASQGNNQVYGGAGDDIIYSGSGDDLIDGGAGNDTIWLAGGLDIIVLEAGNGTDIINNFQVGQTMLGLSDGLTFEDLTIAQNGSNTVISAGDELLASFNFTQHDSFSSDVFVIV